mgnify:CR=1 FL=1
MADVKFGFTDKAGTWSPVTTLEEQEYPTYYNQRAAAAPEAPEADATPGAATTGVGASVALVPEVSVVVDPALFEGHREFQENQRGISYETLLLPYLRGASEITIIDPYIRLPHQGRNLVDLLALLASAKDVADEIGRAHV